MKVIVTGADGFLGSNITRQLVAEGYQVRALIEPSRKAPTLRGLPVELYRGNILSAQDLDGAMKGCSAGVHAAASTAVWPNRCEYSERVNVVGTARVIEATLRAGLSRLVYVGSASSFGGGSSEKPATERTKCENDRFGIGYVDSKHRALELVRDAVRTRGLPAVMIAPTFMIGPYDSGPSSGRLLISLYQRKVPGIPPGGRNYVSVRDVARSIVTALDRGRLGECYIVGNRNLSYEDAFKLFAKHLGVDPPRLKLPKLLTEAVGAICSLCGSLTGRRPPLTLGLARISCVEQYYSSAKAARELDHNPTPIEDAVEEAIAWFRANDMLSRGERNQREIEVSAARQDSRDYRFE